jgi:FkbM family methyltransferase
MNISKHYFTFIFLLPRVITLFKNWPLYLINYLGRRKVPAQYRLRNSRYIIDATGTLAGTIAVVFIRREYGKLSNLKTIIDIGANMGAFSIYAASLSPEAKIYCYEPVERNFEYLQKNIEVNSFSGRVFPFRIAVGSCEGEREINLGESPTHSFLSDYRGVRSEKVVCTTLENILINNNLHEIDLLKINIEGAENEMLENCADSTFERIWNIRMEYHNTESLPSNGDYISSLLQRKGYKIDLFTRYKRESGFIWASKPKP